ncbi:MAG: oxidoreductase [Ilumatobacteraceae bacterium]|nr:oxidoreductase [Ilumatobacteraceae bacterium]
MSDLLPLVDISTWLDGTWTAESSHTVDEALQTSGFLLVSGHGVSPDLGARVRRLAREFFGLPVEVKAKYAVEGQRGWTAPDSVANAKVLGMDTPPDLHESFMVGRCDGDGVGPEADPMWFPPNVWPDEVPELREAMVEYREAMESLALVLMDVLAEALGMAPGWFRQYLDPPVGSLALNWYPSYERVGAARVGQFRIGPHTDWGSITILDRQSAKSGLQIQARDGTWEPAPFVPGALTINTADLLSRWTGDRWRSTMHRVPAPSADAPVEELLSLVFFYDVDPTALIETLPAPIAGPRQYEPVIAGDHLLGKIAAIHTS